ncbi:MAG TPA: hypothetical protein VFG84_00915 [Gemmatimonadaceae bacterium]|nr:hypothetical protein [Gemmatimonadaceae bacterium]
MRRTAWSRALGIVLALWFTVVMVEPAALHNCPVHGGAVAGHAATAAGGHAGAHAASMPDHGGQHQHAVCTCVGTCCAARVAGAALPGATVAVEFSDAVQPRRVAPRRMAAPAVSEPEFLHPYPNGPPAIARVA